MEYSILFSPMYFRIRSLGMRERQHIFKIEEIKEKL